jgi:modification methylase
VITSPPYNKGEKKNSGKLVSAVVYDNYKDDLTEEEYQSQQIEVLNEFARILKPDGSVFYNHKNRYIDGGLISPLSWIAKSDLIVRQEIVWNRIIAANLRGWRFWNTDERIYWLQRKDASPKELEMNYAKMGSVWTIPVETKKQDHPCPFPTTIPEICIGSTCEKDNVVLDPYMGSGTVAVSAIKAKCHFIGFEISKEYFDKANKRIKLEQQQLSLF